MTEIPTVDGRGDRVALIAATVTVVLWASAFVGIRAASEDLSAGPIAFARLLIGGTILGAVVLIRNERLPPRAAIPGLLVCGITWFGVYNVALNEAERIVDAGTAAMLVNIAPILIAILAGILLDEGFPRPVFIGGGVAFAGVALIGFGTAGGKGSPIMGVALCLVAALSYAAGAVSQKPLLKTASPLMITWLACVIGAAVCIPFAPRLISEIPDAELDSLLWTGYLGLFPTAVAFTTWAFALSRMTAGRMSATTYLVPPVAILLSWMFLGEIPPVLAFMGGLLCLVGVAITRRRAAPAPAASPVPVPTPPGWSRRR